jgi:hypothetical protein
MEGKINKAKPHLGFFSRMSFLYLKLKKMLNGVCSYLLITFWLIYLFVLITTLSLVPVGIQVNGKSAF